MGAPAVPTTSRSRAALPVSECVPFAAEIRPLACNVGIPGSYASGTQSTCRSPSEPTRLIRSMKAVRAVASSVSTT